jgi:gluconokinase
MGVAGSGKTAVGELLAKELGVPFLDGDDYHPAANVAKMASGVPLDDADRRPWLDAVAAAIKAMSGKSMSPARSGMGTGFPSDIASKDKTSPAPRLVVACSALKRSYRERLAEAAGRPLLFVLLDASRETLAARLATRRGHFMPASLLDSQLATLERPGAAENAIVVSAEEIQSKVVKAVIEAPSKASIAL